MIPLYKITQQNWNSVLTTKTKQKYLAAYECREERGGKRKEERGSEWRKEKRETQMKIGEVGKDSWIIALYE